MLENNKKTWKTPNVIVVNMEEYEEIIIANARSGGACIGCAGCGVCSTPGWDNSCPRFA